MPAQHGGKTECRILALIPTFADGSGSYYTQVASAVTVCSWRDQFCRKTGRLYSLALAMADPVWTAEEQEALAFWQPLAQQVPDIDANTWELLSGYIILHDIPQVKAICAEIVAEWRKTKRKAARV